MSDFLTELRREVVDAHAAHLHPRRRSAPARRLRSWRPATFLGAVAAAALVLAVALAVRSLTPPEPSGGPRVIKVLQLGGIPVDAVFAEGALWVTDGSRSEVIRIDPARRRVAARIPLRGSPEEIAAGDGELWVRTTVPGTHQTRVWRIDPRSNVVAAHVDVGGGSALAVGAGALWVARRFDQPETIERIDLASGRFARRIAITDTDGLAVTSGALWTVVHDGSVARIDTRRGRIERRWPQLAPSSAGGDSTEVIVADARGAWIVSTERAAILRIDRDRLGRSIAVDASVQPILAGGRDGLWVAAADERRGRYRVMRFDPASGRKTASVDVGAHRPRSLVPVTGGLWVVAGDGTAVLIDS